MKVFRHLKGLLAGCVLVGAVAAHGVEDSYATGMTEKASRGLVNLVTGVVELPVQIVKGYDDGVSFIDAPAGSRSLGALGGLFRGVSHAVGRTAWGAFDLATFWALNPTDNKGLLLLQDANYVWEKGEKKTMMAPCLQDGCALIGRRFERGMNNAVGSFLEVPGQIRKHNRLGCAAPGLPKGIYYMVSRFCSGVGDLALLFVPGPETNLMVPFAEVWPWDAVEQNYYNNVQ